MQSEKWTPDQDSVLFINSAYMILLTAMRYNYTYAHTGMNTLQSVMTL